MGIKKWCAVPGVCNAASWNVKELKNFPIKEKIIIHNRQKLDIFGMTFEVFNEVHSILCPGVGYRITAGKATIYYAGDLISINQRHAALKNVRLYIGDGATIIRPMVRRKDDKLFGHTTIRAQLGWCKKEKVPRAIITHCGTQIVAANAGRLLKKRLNNWEKNEV